MSTITVYTTGPACMQCRLTKPALTTAGIGFEEIDVRRKEAETRAAQAAWLQPLGAASNTRSDPEGWPGRVITARPPSASTARAISRRRCSDRSR